MITGKNFKSKTFCFSYCARIKNCEYILINESYCRLYSLYARYLIMLSTNGTFYQRTNPTNLNDLKFYWPIFNSNVNDIISGNNLYGPVSCSFTTDRAGVSNSAIKFNYGYYKFPTGDYFKDYFTVILWVKPYQDIYSAFFDFGISTGVDNFLLILLGNQGAFKMDLYSNISTYYIATGRINIGYWNHLAIVNRNWYFLIYVNGTLDSGFYVNPLRIVNRTSNFLGGHNWNGNFYGEMDDFKIHQRNLSQNEILNDFLFY